MLLHILFFQMVHTATCQIAPVHKWIVQLSVSSLPAAVLAVPVMQPADWLCCLLQLQLAAGICWLDILPKELHNTEEGPLLVLKYI